MEDETKPLLGPRFNRSGLVGQAKQIVKKLGQGDLVNFTVGNIVQTLKDNGDRETSEEKGQEALDNCLDLRQGNAESIQDYISREEMMSLSLQNSTQVALDEKMRGYWLVRTSALTEQEIAGIRSISREHWTVCCEEGNPADTRCETETRSSR